MSCGAVCVQVARTDAKWQRASAKKSCSSVDASCFTPDGYLPVGHWGIEGIGHWVPSRWSSRRAASRQCANATIMQRCANVGQWANAPMP